MKLDRKGEGCAGRELVVTSFGQTTPFEDHAFRDVTRRASRIAVCCQRAGELGIRATLWTHTLEATKQRTIS